MKTVISVPIRDIQIGDQIARAHNVVHKPITVRKVDNADGSCKGIHVNDTMCYHRTIGSVELVVENDITHELREMFRK